MACISSNHGITKGIGLITAGIRVASSDKLAKLKSAFVKPHGTITAANSFLSRRFYSSSESGKPECSVTPSEPKYIESVPYKVHIEEIGKLNEEIGKLKAQIAQRDEQIKRIVPFLSIRHKIEMFELTVAPDLISPKAVFKDLSEELTYHEAKWRKIVDRKSDPAVARLNSLFKEYGIDENLVCRRVGTFFSIASAKIHTPPLSSYTAEEIIKVLENDFEIKDPVTLNFVRVLMQL